MRAVSVILLAAVAGLAFADPGPEARPPDAACPPPACKVCVCEPKATTRKVYACRCEEYCLPRCDLLSLLRGTCGCGDGPCGELRTRHRLVVKKGPGR